MYAKYVTLDATKFYTQPLRNLPASKKLHMCKGLFTLAGWSFAFERNSSKLSCYVV